MNGKTIKCDMCGANLRFEHGQPSVLCPYCGTQQWSGAHGGGTAAQEAAQPKAERQPVPPKTETEYTAPKEQQAQADNSTLPWIVRFAKALTRLSPLTYKRMGIAAGVLFVLWTNWFTLLLTVALFWHPWTQDKRYSRQRKLYDEASKQFSKARNAAELEEAKAKFLQILSFADAEQKARECEEMIRSMRQREQKRRENTEEIKDLAQEAAASLLNRAADALRNRRGHH